MAQEYNEQERADAELAAARSERAEADASAQGDPQYKAVVSAFEEVEGRPLIARLTEGHNYEDGKDRERLNALFREELKESRNPLTWSGALQRAADRWIKERPAVNHLRLSREESEALTAKVKEKQKAREKAARESSATTRDERVRRAARTEQGQPIDWLRLPKDEYDRLIKRVRG